MKSPFPGMDPYLEQWWRDVHHRLCTYSCDLIQDQLGGSLRARLDERLVVEEFDNPRSIYPDVRVIERPERYASSQPDSGVAVAEPVLLQITSEPARQGFIQIIDTHDGNRVVTVIEFISPSNKIPGTDGYVKYLQKQEECRQAGVNLVEIDLVRAGKRVTIARAFRTGDLAAPYQVCAFRATRRDRCEVYPIPLQSCLPGIRIPLRPTDPDARLDLQALIDMVYRNGAYGQDIDYHQPCSPPLEGTDAEWAQQQLRASHPPRND